MKECFIHWIQIRTWKYTNITSSYMLAKKWIEESCKYHKSSKEKLRKEDLKMMRLALNNYVLLKYVISPYENCYCLILFTFVKHFLKL